MLGPLLFAMYIINSNESVDGPIGNFADSTNVGGVADCEQDCGERQKEISWKVMGNGGRWSLAQTEVG